MATSPKKPSSRKPAAARPTRRAPRQNLGDPSQVFLRIGDDIELAGGAMVRVVARTPSGHPILRQLNGSTDMVAAPVSFQEPYQEPPSETLTRNSVVFDSLHLIGRRIDEAWNAVAELEQAAASILVPQPPAGENAAAGKDPQPVESPAVSLMNDLARGLERLTNRINHITGRVQA